MEHGWLRGPCQEGVVRAGIFTAVHGGDERTWADVVSVEPRELQGGHRKTSLPMQTIGQRHRLPRDDVQLPSLEAVKTRLGKVLSISQHPALSGCLGWRPEVSPNVKYPIIKDLRLPRVYKPTVSHQSSTLGSPSHLLKVCINSLPSFLRLELEQLIHF